MALVVTPIATLPFGFDIRMPAHGQSAMTINRMPDLIWNAENIQMKYFTVDTIQRLGALIETQKPNLFLT